MLVSNNPLIDALQESKGALGKPEQWFFSCTILSNMLSEQGQGQLSYLWKSIARQNELNQATYHILVGATYIQLEDWEQAIHHNKEAIAVDQGLALGYSNLSKLYEKLGEVEESREYLYKFMSLRPEQSSAERCEELGIELLEKGQPARALDCYRWAIRNNPEQWTAYYRIAHILTLAKQPERAIRYYQLLLERDPNQAEAHQKLGKLFLSQQRHREAIENFQAALVLEPDFTWAHFGLARAFLALKQWDDAIEHFQAVIVQKNDLTWAYFGLARAFLALNQWGDAIENFQIVIAQEPDFSQEPDLAWTYFGLARGFLALKQWDGVIEACESALAIDGEQLWVYRHMAKALLAQGRLSEAQICWKKIAALEGWEEWSDRGYDFTCDSLTHQIPLWLEQLQESLNIAKRTNSLSVLQIGGEQGMWSCWMLDRILTNPEDRLLCLAHPLSQAFQSNLAKAQSKCNVISPQVEPSEFLRELGSDHQARYDLIYIQNHRSHSQFLYSSACLSWTLLRDGGVMVLHNGLTPSLEQERADQLSTKSEIESFMSDIEGQFTITHQGENLFIKKQANANKSVS